MKTSFWKLLSCLGAAAGLACAGMPKAAAQCGLPINPSNSTLIHPQAGSTPATNAASADFDDHHGDDDASIVGLWHVEFLIDNQMVQEAFQIWNVGGTEVHNPNIPLGGGVCLGTWKQVGRTHGAKTWFASEFRILGSSKRKWHGSRSAPHGMVAARRRL